VFQAIIVQQADHPRFQGRFSIVAPPDPDDPTGGVQQLFRFGVIDECGKINLNTLMKLDSSGQKAHDVLMMLPNMTEDVANSILDWIDPDSDSRPNGAEDDYYTGLIPPYHCKNGPLDSLEELLLVKGVTPQLLFGNDRNRNGILDPEEDDGTGVLDRGWSAYLTIYSREQNVDSSGNPRIYVNSKDLSGLYDQLSAVLGLDLAAYIVAYRLYGQTTTSTGSGQKTASNDGDKDDAGSSASKGGSSPTAGAGTQKLAISALGNLKQGRPNSIASLYQLVNGSVTIPAPSGSRSPPMVVPSPLNDPASIKQLLPLVLDELTTVQDTELPARINVNTAPRTVLAALPGLSDADVQNILDSRPDLSSSEAPDPIYQTPAWLITEANFSPQTLRTLEKYITARSQVYRVQSLGYFDGGGPTARIEAVIDTNGGRPRIIYWRDLTELGKGFDLQPRP
jgi:DNA uptake protein ComE-like DNA-binding protein